MAVVPFEKQQSYQPHEFCLTPQDRGASDRSSRRYKGFECMSTKAAPHETSHLVKQPSIESPRMTAWFHAVETAGIQQRVTPSRVCHFGNNQESALHTNNHISCGDASSRDKGKLLFSCSFMMIDYQSEQLDRLILRGSSVRTYNVFQWKYKTRFGGTLNP